MKDINFFIDEHLGTEIGKIINGKTLKNMGVIASDVYKQLSTDLKESDAVSIMMEDFPPMCKQDPLEVQMKFIKDHYATTGKKIRLEDVPETMYGGALPVAKSRKTKRKAISKDEYLSDALEQPAKEAKRAKNDKKAAVQENTVGTAIPTIQEEVEDLEADKILPKRTRSGKAAATSKSAPDQPSTPKRKRKTVMRKLKESRYVEDEDQIAEATDLVTRELKKKKALVESTLQKDAEIAASLQKALEIAKEIEVPASSILREDVGADAQEVIKAAEVMQELVTTKAESLVMVTIEGVQEGNTSCSEAGISEASRGNSVSQHPVDVINIESSSTSISHSTTLSSSSTSSGNDDIPLSQVYTSINKGPSPSTKLPKKPDDDTSEPINSNIDERIISMAQMKADFCNRLPANHSLNPPMIEPISFVPADEEVIGEQVGLESVNLRVSSSHPTSTTQTSEPSVLENLISHYSGELPGVESNCHTPNFDQRHH